MTQQHNGAVTNAHEALKAQGIDPSQIAFTVGGIALKDGRYIPNVPEGKELEALQLLGSLITVLTQKLFDRQKKEAKGPTVDIPDAATTEILLGK